MENNSLGKTINIKSMKTVLGKPSKIMGLLSTVGQCEVEYFDGGGIGCAVAVLMFKIVESPVSNNRRKQGFLLFGVELFKLSGCFKNQIK